MISKTLPNCCENLHCSLDINILILTDVKMMVFSYSWKVNQFT